MGGEGGSPLHAASPSVGREGVTFTNSTEAFLKGFLQSRFFLQKPGCQIVSTARRVLKTTKNVMPEKTG
jgi:hypothetical protein